MVRGALGGTPAAGQDDLVAAGRRIYREGRLPSGAPVSATVQGDVPVLGTQFSCQSCHGRSGLGGGEGSVVVPPISGPLLFEPGAQLQRPAYDEGKVERALRQGIDAAGRPLKPLMPRYRLSDGETAAVAAYLRSLSAVISPGVSATEIRFATIITSDVPAPSRGAMLDVLRVYFDEKVRETRIESRRPGHDPPATLGGRRPTSFRRWALDIWDLTGPSSGWGAQLDVLYRERPVFAVLGGLSGLSWRPIHEFCESHELPCLLPSTDLPDADEGDFYSLYFSRGLFLEADLIAQALGASPLPNTVQVFRRDTPGALAAAALGRHLRAREGRLEDWRLEPGEPVPVARLAAKLGESPGAVVVLWLGRGDLTGLGSLGAAGAGRLFLSSTLLERRWDGLPSPAPVAAFVAHPFALLGEGDAALTRFRIWLRARGIAPREERIQANAYFACLAANEGVMHIRRHFYRDYFMDVLDHAQGLSAYLPLYPSPSLGPGQRFMAKGGYILPLASAAPSEPASSPTLIVP